MQDRGQRLERKAKTEKNGRSAVVECDSELRHKAPTDGVPRVAC